MPDDQVQFKSPTTGKVQAVPAENWDDALKQGYVPTTHKVMYSPDGKRGMVPNEDLRDYMKQGYQTTPKTQFESSVTGEGTSLKGAGGAALQAIKGMIPSAPEGTTVNPLNPDFFTKKNLVGSPSMDFSKGTLAQGGQEAAAEYSRARVAGTNPVAAGYSAAISGAGPLVGVSDLAQQELAAKGEGGQIIGQSAVPAALALSPFASEGMKAAGVPGKVATALRTEGGTGAIKPGVHAASRLAGTGLGHLIGVPGLGEFGGFMFGPEAAESIIPKKGMPPPPPEFPGASLPSTEDFYANRGAELEAIRKMQEAPPKATPAGESPASILKERQKRMAAYAEMQEDFANRAKQQQKDLANRLADAEKARQKEITDWSKLDKVSEEDHQAFADRMSEIEAERQSTLADMERLKEQHAASLNARKGAKPPPATPTPSPFAGMTSTATPIGNATLPEVPQGQPTLFPQRPGGMTPPPSPVEPPTPITSKPTIGSQIAAKQGTSLLSRAKTPIELGVEPDMNNPAHVKMINDIIGQGLNEAAINKLKVRAKLGDRFAAVALDYWRSKTGR